MYFYRPLASATDRNTSSGGSKNDDQVAKDPRTLAMSSTNKNHTDDAEAAIIAAQEDESKQQVPAQSAESEVDVNKKKNKLLRGCCSRYPL